MVNDYFYNYLTQLKMKQAVRTIISIVVIGMCVEPALFAQPETDLGTAAEILVESQVEAQIETQVAVSENTQETLIFGMAPTLGPIKMEQVFGPLARKIDQALPQAVVFRTRRSREEFNSAFYQAQFDIVVLHPFDYLFSRVDGEYLPVIRKKTDLQPVFVSAEKNLKSLDQLRGKVIAFPSTSGFVYALGQQKLAEYGLEKGDYQQLINGDFNSCLQSVANQRADACLTIRNLVWDFSKTIDVKFYIIDETDPIPHIVLLLRKSLSPYLEKLRTDLLALNDTEEGRRLLKLTLFDEVESITEMDLEKMKENPYAKKIFSPIAIDTNAIDTN